MLTKASTIAFLSSFDTLLRCLLTAAKSDGTVEAAYDFPRTEFEAPSTTTTDYACIRYFLGLVFAQNVDDPKILFTARLTKNKY